MSHELRTPLNAILGFSEIMHSQAFGEMPRRYHAYVDDIRIAGRQLLLEGQAAIPPIAGPGAGGDSVASVPPAAVAEPTVGMVSLREVMASGGSYSAVMVVGVERMRVKIGDDLPGGLTVAGIGKDWVELSTGAGSMRLTMRD